MMKPEKDAIVNARDVALYLTFVFVAVLVVDAAAAALAAVDAASPHYSI